MGRRLSLRVGDFPAASFGGVRSDDSVVIRDFDEDEIIRVLEANGYRVIPAERVRTLEQKYHQPLTALLGAYSAQAINEMVERDLTGSLADAARDFVSIERQELDYRASLTVIVPPQSKAYPR